MMGYYGIGPDGMVGIFPAAIPPAYPRDVLIYCEGCGCHYTIVVKAADDFAKCPTNPDHKLGESTVTKAIEKALKVKK